MGNCKQMARGDTVIDWVWNKLIDFSPLERGSGTRAEMNQLWDRLEPHLEEGSNKYFTGHRLASVEHYPKDFNDSERWKCYRDLGELLYEGYKILGCDSLELDLQLVPTLKTGQSDLILSITHDPPERLKMDGVMDYVERNRFSKVFSEYVEKEYWREHKLDLELKLKDDDFVDNETVAEILTSKCDEEEELLIGLTLDTIDEVLADHPERDAIYSSVRFVSFSLEALKYTYMQAGDAYTYYFIATTNTPLRKLVVSVFGKTPLGREMIKKLKYKTPWLTGMWFDPRFIDDPIRTINEIQAARSSPLELMAATYYSDFEDIVQKFSSGTEKIELHGLIFDFCEPK